MAGAILPKNLSYSACELINRCTLRYLFENRMRLKQEKPEIDYGLAGQFLHAAISGSIRRMKRKDLKTITNPKNFVLEQTMAVLQTVNHPKLQACNEFCVNNYSAYMANRFEYLVDNDLDLDLFLPIKNEAKLTAEINGVPFTGVLDAVFQDPELRLVDWKSTSNPIYKETEIRIKESEQRQAACYLMLYEAVNHIRVPYFYTINLRRKVNLLESRLIITDDMIEAKIQSLPEIWDTARGDIFTKNPNGGACFLCNYKMRCKLHPNVIDLKSYDPDLYDPFKNY